MTGIRNWWISAALLLPLLWLPASAQTFQFLPEAGTYVKLGKNVRFVFQAKRTRENGSPIEAEFGPSIDVYWRPLKKLTEIATLELDDSKSRMILLSAGYRYLRPRDAPPTNRVLLVATPRLPFKSGILISDRNRGELNFSNGDLTWRYRNRLMVERTFRKASYHPTPYAAVEVYYDSRFHKWSSTVVDIGCIFPIKKRAEIDAYYEHQNNTGRSSNQQINALGLILNLYFRRR
jgi:Protein of unknown function (DUF2490)